MRSITATLVIFVTLVSGAGITAAASPTEQAGVRDRAVTWLAAQVTPGGALISPSSGTESPAMTAQGALALAGSGAPHAVVESMIDYLEAHVDDYVAPGGAADSPGSLGWLILDAVASGVSPTDFGGVDLVSRLRTTQRSAPDPDAGLFGSSDPTYDGAFRQSLALIALSAVGIADAPGMAWLQDQQCANGGFVAYRSDTSQACPAVDPATFSGPDTNSTAFATIALHLLGDDASAGQALTWLEGTRTIQGGFAYLGSPSQPMDANSTGLVLTAFTALKGAADPQAVAALASLQVPESGDPADRGGFAFQPQRGELFPNLMATVQALLGLAGQPLPFAPTREVPTMAVPTPRTTDVPSTIPAPEQRAPAAANAATPVAANPTYAG